jgi:RNA polymerase sigma-70 factor (ECF subfamily)
MESNNSIRNNVTEQDIISRAKEGDRKALAELVTLYSDRIYNLALRILRSREDAEDVLQETFLAVVEKLHTFNEQSSFFTWIYRIATNASLMKIRKKRIRFRELPDRPDFGEQEPIDWSQNPIKEVQNQEIKKILDRAIGELSDIYRSVFILRDIEQLSIRETAKILDISEENVKIRLRRARLFLREKLAAYFEEHGAEV